MEIGTGGKLAFLYGQSPRRIDRGGKAGATAILHMP